MNERTTDWTEPNATQQAYRWHCHDRESEYAARVAFVERMMANSAKADGSGSALQGMLSQVLNIIGEVHRNGYCIVPDLLDSAAVEHLRAGLDPLLTQSAEEFDRLIASGPRPAFHIHNVFAKSRAADAVSLHPTIRAVVGAILGFDFILHAGAIVTAHNPGCCEQPLHRDDASFYALPRPRMPLVITAAIALDDFTDETGATRLAPGSCWWEREREPVPSDVIAAEMTAGSVLVWDGALFHGGGANITRDQTRRTLLLNYTRGWLRSQMNQYLSVPRDVVLSLPPELQKDLGYARSLRALGECDGHEPIRYLQAIQQLGDGAQAQLGPEGGATPKATGS